GDNPGESRGGAPDLRAISRGLGDHAHRQGPQRRRRAPPRGGSQGWAPTAIREMLHNELYRGRAISNRTKKAHRRGTKTQDTRPVEDLIEVELPECRIVSEELWEAAH